MLVLWSQRFCDSVEWQIVELYVKMCNVNRLRQMHCI